jgi:hypothetical protein
LDWTVQALWDEMDDIIEMEKQIRCLIEDALDQVDRASTYEQFSDVLWSFLQETRRLVEANGLGRVTGVDREMFDTILRKSVPRGFLRVARAAGSSAYGHK